MESFLIIHNLIQGSFSDEDSNSVIRKRKRKINTKSKDFLEFRPKREAGLYKELIEECDVNYEVGYLI